MQAINNRTSGVYGGQVVDSTILNNHINKESFIMYHDVKAGLS